MNLLLLFCVVHVVLAKHTKEKEKKKCEGVSVNGKMHEEMVLVNGINRPYQLSYYGTIKSYVLFFTYNTGNMTESTFETGYTLNGWELPAPIKNVKNGFATAIDHKKHIIYLGGSEGIYAKKFNTSSEAVLLLPKIDIWDMFVKDGLYFIPYPQRRLHKLVGNHSEMQHHIHEKIYQFAIDGEEDTFITNKTGLFMIRNGTDHRNLIKGSHHKRFRDVEVNKKGIAHFCGPNEIYVVDKKNHELRQIAKIKDIFGLTFDEDDNIIYSDPHQIVRLLPKPCNT